MRYPADLRENGNLGFIAPSFGCATEPYRSAFLRGQEVLETLGYRLNCGPNALAGEGVGISNTPEKCGAEVNEYLTDPSLDAVISCGGGELMCEILDHVDFDAVRKAEPVWFMGFSDNTNLTFLLPTLCDTAAVYGPNAPAFGMDPWHPVLTDALALLTGKTDTVRSYGRWELEGLKDEEHPYEPYNVTEPTVLTKVNAGDAPVRMEGRMLGGCLDVLNILAGTSYDKAAEFADRYREDGIIWFFESCDLSVFDMRRALWHLEHCGWFKNMKGFLIGRPLRYGEEIMGLDQYTAVAGILGKYGVPVIMDADLGHLPPSMPMMVGARAAVTVEGNDITIRYERV